MAWKKIIVSGSSADLRNLSVDSAVTASFFVGDGSGLTNLGYDSLVNVPSGIISSSAQQVTGLLNQDLDLGSGTLNVAVISGSNISGSFSGDGSGLTNLTVDQAVTVTQDFSNQTSVTTFHGFRSKDVVVVAYDDNDFQIIPSSVQAIDNDRVTVTFAEATTGRLVVGKGGHIVTGAVTSETTVTASFSNTASISIEHLYGTKNVIVSVYDDNDRLIIPSEVTLTNNNFVNVQLAEPTSGFVVVAKAGHIVSGSLSYANLINKPTLVSGSSQITISDTTGYTDFSSSIASSISGISNDFADITNKPTLVSSSIAGDAQGQVKVNGVNVNIPDLQTSSSPTFNSLLLTGDLIVQGTRTELQVSELRVEDKLITLASGSTTSAAADGAGFEIAGADKSLQWDHAAQAFKMNSDFIPAADETYDLGSPTAKWKDLYLSGSTIFLDNVALSINDGKFTVTDTVTQQIVEAEAKIKFSDILGKPTLVSGSSQVTISETTGFTAFSSSIAEDIAGISTDFADITGKPTLVSGSSQITISDTTGYSEFSSSLATDIAQNKSDIASNASDISALQSFSSSLDATFASDSELTSVSSSLASAVGTNTSNLTSVSGALATDIASNKTNIDAILSASSADADSFAEIVALINSVDLENDQAFASFYTSSNGRLSTLEAASSSFATTLYNLDNTYATDTELSAVSGALAADIAGLGSIYATDAELNASSSALISAYTAADTALSSSLASAITSEYQAADSVLSASIAADIAGLGDIYATDAELNASSSALISAYTAADTTLSSSLAVDIASNLSAIQSNDSDISTLNTQMSVATASIAANEAQITTNKNTITAILSASSADADSFAEIVALINSVDLENDTAFASFYTSSNGRLDTLEAASSSFASQLNSLDDTYATDAELSAVSGALALSISSISTDFADITGKPTLVSGSSQITISETTGYSAFSSSIAEDIAGLDSIYATDAQLNASSSALTAAYTAADTALSSSLASALTSEYQAADSALSASLAADIAGLGDVYATDVELNASSSALISAYTAADTALSSSLAVDIATNDGRLGTLESKTLVSASIAGDNQGQIKVNGQNVDVTGLQTTSSPKFVNLVLTGDLTVQGTTTSIQTANLLVEDKFILLNSGSANPNEGGIVIDEGNGAGHAFVYDSNATRFAFTGSLSSDATSVTPDAFAAAVVDIDAGHVDKPEYQKNGNIKTDNGTIYIFA